MKRQHPDNPDLFWCPKCKTYKARGEFYKTSWGNHGVTGYCKECTYTPKSERTCAVCGNNFIAKGRKKYCSEKCHGRGSHRNKAKYYRERHPVKIVTKICVLCGKQFSYENSQRGLIKYCSHECRIKYARRPKYDRICVVCGKQFISNQSVVKTCSKECARRLIFGEKISVSCPVCGETRAVFSKSPTIKKKKSNVIICERCRHNKANRERRLLNPEKTTVKDKARNKRKVMDITDGYVRGRIKARANIELEDITQPMIDMKRQAIIMKRTLKQFKEWRKEYESNNADVQREQRENEEADGRQGHTQP